jgi:hypothetical protein
VESIIRETANGPDYVVTYVNDEKLNQQLIETSQWTQVYTNRRYTLWSRNN